MTSYAATHEESACIGRERRKQREQQPFPPYAWSLSKCYGMGHQKADIHWPHGQTQPRR